MSTTGTGTATGYEDYSALRISVADGVARVTIDHPPLNLLDLTLMLELDRFGREVEADDRVRVVVFDSADADFFIAHADIGLIQQLPTEVAAADAPLGFFHQMVERFRTMPKATVAVIEGRVRGGGSEFVSSLDMRFAARGRAVLGQPEVPLGILPGGSGTQRLPRLIGRGRALEVILGGADVDAETAERWGWVNRTFDPDDLRPFVDALAASIASFPPYAVAAAKAAVAAAESDPVPGLGVEWHHFTRCLPEPETVRRLAASLDLGAQTRDGELDLTDLYERLGEA